MFKNYFRIATRILARNKLYTLINVLGLALGVCGCIVIWLVGSYELSFDRFHPGGDRIYRVVSGGKGGERKSTSILSPMAGAIREDIAGMEAVTAFFTENRMREVKVPVTGKPTAIFHPRLEGEDEQTGVILADADWFQVFSYRWLAGNPAEALNKPFQVVLTEKAARLYFGDVPPTAAIGRELIYDDSLHMHVSGVVRDWTAHSDLAYTDILSFPTIQATYLKEERHLTEWKLHPVGYKWYLPDVYVKLAKGVRPALIEAQMNRIAAEHIPTDTKHSYSQALQPLRDVHFNSEYNDNRRKAHLPTLYALAGIAIFILILAAVNFINLATAQSLQRAKEIGVRKVLGSGRRGLVLQFLIETGLLTALAMVIAALLVWPVMGFFREYIPEGVHFYPWAAGNLLFLAGITIGVTLLAGFYPARVLAGYQPVHTLKGSGAIKGGEKWWLRRSLVVFQFTISLVFIIVTLVIGNQIRYMLSTDYGFRTDAIVTVQGQGGILDTTTRDLKLLEQGFSQLPGVATVVREFTPPIGGGSWVEKIEYKGKDPKRVPCYLDFADERFVPFYGLRLLAGRSIRHSDSLVEFVINETAARQFGFKDLSAAIGQVLYFEKKPLPIVGVVADFHFASFHEVIQPMVIGHSPGFERYVGIKLASTGQGVDQVKATLDAMDKVYRSVYPGAHLNFGFMDDHIRQLYENEQKTASLVRVAMGLAVFISCMGLFGLSLFTAERRAGEIGIRKVLGATTADIALMLNRDFIRLVLLALVVASPIAWILAHRWLQDFAYRVGVDVWVFVLAGLGAIGLAVMTVSYQSIKAAVVNPVKSLKTE
ncbi:ABC transporter permease [Puia sp.]|jgi:ABC-type antimicrobial peptide transport system permease subunit|uniref:ABC transporter permease n=1 Tax=Puia sp. TaxID=2045100 RepID=UPI002F406919